MQTLNFIAELHGYYQWCFFDISMPSSRNCPEFRWVEFGKKVHHGLVMVKRWILGFWRMTTSKHYWRKRAVSTVWSLEDLDEVDDSVVHQHVVPQPIEHVIALLQNERLGRNQNWSRSTSFLRSTYSINSFAKIKFDIIQTQTYTKIVYLSRQQWYPISCFSYASHISQSRVERIPWSENKMPCSKESDDKALAARQWWDERGAFLPTHHFSTNFGSLSKEWNQSLWLLAWH